MNFNTIRFADDRLYILDQTLLPNEKAEIELTTLDQVIEAIKSLRVRGAPAIGITAAYGLFREVRRLVEERSLTDKRFYSTAEKLKKARPTAVNLEWAVDRMSRVYEQHNTGSDNTLLNELRQCAADIHNEDRQTCKAIGEYGAGLVKDGYRILTHCNAGILATGGTGTALSVIYTAQNQGKNLHVFVDETRPLGQGTRLTYWELRQNQVPATLITDNMAGSLMQSGSIDLVVVGADRIASNGDFANKIGTYPLAVLASYHHVPFYCAAPRSSFDLKLNNGSEIPIEMRDKREVTGIWHIQDENAYAVYNPAFDITPHSLISGIITEFGIIKIPFTQNIKQFLTF